MPTAQLNRAAITAAVPNEQGVYQLLHESKLVYIGKTDADAGLRARLVRHADKIMHRAGLDPRTVTFKAIRLFVFTVMDLETELLKTYMPAWNGRGFGSNDPGRERDTTRIKPVNFDAQFPLDIHRLLEFPIPPGAEYSAEAVLQAIQASVPWKLRRQNRGGRKCHSDLETTLVKISGTANNAWTLLAEIVSQLPPGWQATALKSHAILYKESRDYPDPLAVARSPD